MVVLVLILTDIFPSSHWPIKVQFEFFSTDSNTNTWIWLPHHKKEHQKNNLGPCDWFFFIVIHIQQKINLNVFHFQQRIHLPFLAHLMMTSSNGNIFRVTGPLSGEFTGHWWIPGNSPVTGEFPAQRPAMRSFDVFFDLHLNVRLSKQSWGWWFGKPSR